MRHSPTEAEQKLWLLLRDRRFATYKFRRQVPIGSFIVDFLCPAQKLIVELDGSQHADSAYDAKRDAWLTGAGFHILRIWNNDLAAPDIVLDAIWHALHRSTLQ